MNKDEGYILLFKNIQAQHHNNHPSESLMRVSGKTAYGGLVKALEKSFTQMAGNVPVPVVIAKLIKKGIEATKPKTRYVGG